MKTRDTQNEKEIRIKTLTDKFNSYIPKEEVT